MAVKNNLS